MKYRSKETVEAVTFEEFVEIGLATPGANIRGGVSWSFEYKGCVVTHEKDDHYNVSYKYSDGTLCSVPFARGEFLIDGGRGKFWTQRPEQFHEEYEAVHCEEWIHDHSVEVAREVSGYLCREGIYLTENQARRVSEITASELAKP